MTHTRFSRTRLATSLSVILSAMATTPLYAQEAAQDEQAEDSFEVIQVSGIRNSYLRAMDMKRGADGVVDGISAEDIGKFPDTNLAESLQRITGVSIDRVNGEGSRVTVRGFGPDFNLVTVNGRQMPGAQIEATSASASRSFDFNNLASEGIAGVEVFKTSRAAQPTGGIGSLINILTARPLNNPGLVANIGVKAVHDTSTQDGSNVTPEISGIYSNTFNDDTFGIALTGAYQERDYGFNSAETSSGWYTIRGLDGDWGSLPTDGSFVNRPQENDVYSVPRNLLYSFNELERTRTNGQLVLQYRPNDKITTTFEYLYSELEISQRRQEMSTWFNGVPTSGEYTQGTNTVGSVVGPVIYTDATCCDVGLGTGEWATVNENKSVAFTIEYDVNDNLSFMFDYHDSEAEAGPDGPNGSNNVISAVQFDRVSTTVDYSQDFPVMDITFADGVAGLDPSRMATSGTSFRNSYMKTEIEQAQLHGSYTFDEGIVESIDFGVATTEVTNRSAFSNAQRDTWGGYGTPEDYPDSIFRQETVRDKFDELNGSDNPNLEPFYYSSNLQDLIDAISGIAAANGETISPCGTVLCADPNYQVDRTAEEEQLSFYLQANLEMEWGNMPVSLNVGVRYEDTEINSRALVPLYTKIVWAGDNEFSAIPEGEGFTELAGEYDHWLPAIDFKIDVTDDIVLRASYSESITRPSYSDIQGGRTINQLLRFDGGTGNQGNPGLLPFESQNIDLSVEWYYEEGSYFSVGYYDKTVDNFIATDVVNDTVFNLPHPAQGPRFDEAAAAVGSTTDFAAIRQYFFDNGFVDANGDIVGVAGQDAAANFRIFTPVNEREGSVDGFEIALQHMFGDSGFGVIVNYTTVDGDVEYDNYNTNKGENIVEQFVLPGLSDTANFVAFYEDNGWSARIAYNWRDRFFVSPIDGNGELNPIYNEEYYQVDANVSYDIDENLTVFIEGINITDQNQRTHGRHPNMVIAALQGGPRYHVGARYKF